MGKNINVYLKHSLMLWYVHQRQAKAIGSETTIYYSKIINRGRDLGVKVHTS